MLGQEHNYAELNHLGFKNCRTKRKLHLHLSNLCRLV